MDEFSRKVNEQAGNGNFKDQFSEYDKEFYKEKKENKKKNTDQTRIKIYVPRQALKKKVFAKDEGEYISFDEIKEDGKKN